MVYYKMKAILLLALSAIILSQSYGFAYGAVDVYGNPIPGPNVDVATISVATDSSSYVEGDKLIFSGRFHLKNIKCGTSQTSIL